MAYCRYYRKKPDNVEFNVLCSGAGLWPPCLFYEQCLGYSQGKIQKPKIVWGTPKEAEMERYRVEATLEVIVSTCIELSDSELEKLDDSWVRKRRYLEALLRDRLHVESYDGNGGRDKLIGVVGRENSIRCDSRYHPKLVNIQKIM